MIQRLEPVEQWFWVRDGMYGVWEYNQNAVSGRNFSFLEGVTESHHESSHHEKTEKKLEQYKRIGRWHVAQYAYLLEKLRSIREGDGTLLDHSMILFGAGMRDGNAHNPHNLPLVIAGRGNGSIAPGRHLVYENDSPMANLHLSLLRSMGAKADRFADSTGVLEGIANPDYAGKPA